MSADASLLTLPASSNNDDCKNFVAALGAAKGGPVYVDASQCTQMTARFAQLLVLASRAWSVESLSLRIINPSEAFVKAIRRLGLSDILLSESGAE